MEQLTCKKCGGRLTIDDKCLICSKCGEIYYLSQKEEHEQSVPDTTESEEAPIKIENQESPASYEKHINKMKQSLPMFKSLCFFAILIFLYIFIFSQFDESHQIKHVLRKNNYNDYKVVTTVELNPMVEGLEGENYLVLLKRSVGGVTRYGMGAINIGEKAITDVAFAYPPLNIVMDKIFLSGEQTNIENLEKARTFINSYGINCFEDQEYAENYLCMITGSDGIIDTKLARQAIIDSISYILPNIQNSPDFYVVFENETANPTHYAALSSETQYNWTHIFPENVYNVWKANTDRSTQETMIALYGQPYVLKEVWAVVDKNLNQVGTFSSLSAVKELYEKNAKASTNSKKGNSAKSNTENSLSYPFDIIKTKDSIYADIVMDNGGIIGLELYPNIAPITVSNFVYLAKKGFYDGLTFHRVIEDFMIQGGCPNADGKGGPGYKIKGEFASNGFTNELRHERGVISMARTSDPNSAGSQFFIMHKGASHLNGEQAAFGKVIKGMEVVDEIACVETDSNDKPIKPVIIKTIMVK